MHSPRAGDVWDQGSAYERYVGRWSRQVAPAFLDLLRPASDLRWVDVGCGTGALSAAILERCAPASVTGVEPSEGFRRTAAVNLGERVPILPGDAASVPLPDAFADVVVSGLVLNFVPDAPAALTEMRRVTRGGGALAAYVWDYAGRMEFLRTFWDAAVALDPAVAAADEGERFPLCRPERLRALFETAGLARVEISPIDVPTPFRDFEDFWQPFLGGQGPAPTYVMSLNEPTRAKLRDAVRSRLPIASDGSITLTARAWAASGRC